MGSFAKEFGMVALRKESVDRNVFVKPCPHMGAVALRKESVDRNVMVFVNAYCRGVALRKESVDRNTYRRVLDTFLVGRSPQGERG